MEAENWFNSLMMVDKTTKNPRARRGPRKATPERLEKAALFYLERYASSSENLRRVLMRRVDASARVHGTDREEGAQAVDAILQRFLRAGLLDDTAFAEARAASLHRRGVSMRGIRMKLGQKGVSEEDIDKALAALADMLHPEEEGDAELQAALNYARRRRIGPFRREKREEYRDRDLAAFGRQGFSYDTARQILEMEPPPLP